MMNTIAEWFMGSAWINAYWSAPAGLFTLIVLLVCSVGNIMLEWVEDTLTDRIFFTVYALCSVSTLVHIYKGTEPYNIVKTLLLAFAIQCLIKFVHRIRVRMRTGKTVVIHPGEHL